MTDDKGDEDTDGCCFLPGPDCLGSIVGDEILGVEADAGAAEEIVCTGC